MAETAPAHSDTTIKVLSIDGGGLRGIIPAMILAELEKRLGKELYKVFDLIAGTSTGGIIALAIGTQSKDGGAYPPGKLAEMYVEKGPSIFRKGFLTCLRQFLKPKYSPRPLEKVLEEFFGQTLFSTALTPLLISSYDIEHELPFFFKSHKILDRKDSEYDWRVTEIARATSAAPTYFPPARLVEKGGKVYALVDGGVCVNNPAMAAFAEACRLYGGDRRFVVISVGTGDRQDRYQYHKARKWGLLGWALKIVPVFMDSVSEAADYELDSLLSHRYYRLQPPSLCRASNNMDDASPANLDQLQTVASDYIKLVDGTLNKICTELETGRGSNLRGIGMKP
jgi:patatin-like phospholipase/acyl hydrolase